MYTGLLHLHNLLRWVLLILLVVALIQAFSARKASTGAGLKKTSLYLLISAHIQFLIGLYQWIVGPWGYKLIADNGMGVVMKNASYRFFAIEHSVGMLIAIVLITIARGKVKKSAYRAAGWLYLIALLLILATIPWPFREAVARPIFPGM
jgi:hypothetical protein